MLETAKKYNKIHMIDHELRFNPNRKKIREWISKWRNWQNSTHKYFKCI